MSSTRDPGSILSLGGEVTFFGKLGVVEGGRGGIEIGAAVLPVGIEKQRVEPLIEVVVMRDVRRARPRKLNCLSHRHASRSASSGLHQRKARP